MVRIRLQTCLQLYKAKKSNKEISAITEVNLCIIQLSTLKAWQAEKLAMTTDDDDEIAE